MSEFQPIGSPLKQQGKRIYYSKIRDSKTGLIYSLNDNVLMTNEQAARYPYIGRLLELFVDTSKNNTVYLKTRWYYRRVDIPTEHQENIPALSWTKDEASNLTASDAQEFEVFYSTNHTDNNEATSIQGHANLTNQIGFTEKLAHMRHHNSNKVLDQLQVPVEYLFCRYK